jgi:hypothetical protein
MLPVIIFLNILAFGYWRKITAGLFLCPITQAILSLKTSIMKKTTMFMAMLLVAAIFAGTSNAQDVKGVNHLNLGIGVGTFGFSGSGGIPIVASFEHGVTDKIGVGAYLGYLSRSFGTDYRWNYYMIGARGSYHFNELLNVSNDKVDIYGGAMLFYRGFSQTYKGTGTPYDYNYGGLDFALHAGGRYMFSQAIGGFAELGYGISPLQLGLTVQL